MIHLRDATRAKNALPHRDGILYTGTEPCSAEEYRMKLNYKRTFFVGFAFMAISAFWQMYDSLVPKILTGSFGLSEGMFGTGGIMALDNILALFLLPLFGALSDRTKTRIGKRMPFITFGTLAAVICMLFMPVGNRMHSLTLFMVGLGLSLLAMATYRSPAVALMPTVTPKPLRSKANAVINLMGAAGGIVTLLAISVLVPAVDHPDYLPIFLFVAVFMLISLMILRWKVDEPMLTAAMPPEPEEETVHNGRLARPQRVSLILILSSVFLWFMGYNAVTTWFSMYGEVVWGLKGSSFAYTLLVAQAAAIVSYIPVGIVASKIGRKKTILIGVLMLAAAFGSAVLFESFTASMFAVFALAGVGWATINVNSYPMVVELASGSNVGKYTGYYYTFSMAAQILTPILSGEILNSAALGYGYLFPYGTLFVMLSFVTMLFVRHGDVKPQRRTKLESFDVED
jgi:maltose/moltooligosaccharide transporter